MRFFGGPRGRSLAPSRRMVPRRRPDDGRDRGLTVPERGRRRNVEAVELVRDECRRFPVAVAEEQPVETSVFPPDDSNFFARDESEPERRSSFGLHQREQIAVRQTRSREQAGDGIAVLDLDPGRFRPGRRLGGKECDASDDGESERPRAPTPEVRGEFRQGSQWLERSCDSGILGAGQRLALRAGTIRPS